MIGRFTIAAVILLGLAVSTPGWAQNPDAGYGYGGQPAYAPGYSGMQGPQYRYQALPDDRGGGYEDTAVEQAVKETFRHAWFRVEYLLWDIRKPGDQILGAATAVGNLRVPFDVNDPNTGTTLTNAPITSPTGTTTGVVGGGALAPTTDHLNSDQNNGIRGSFGLPTNYGTFETNIFALQNSSSTYIDPTIPVPTAIAPNPQPLRVVAQPVLDNNTSNDFLIYTNFYQVQLKTNVWGSDANWVFEPFDPNSSFQIRPIFGFRYVNYMEQLNQTGIASDTTLTAPVNYTRTINASTINNSYGPQAGFRAELIHPWFTLGVEPKLTMGVNNYKADLFTGHINSSDFALEPARLQTKHDTTFSPIFDLRAYSRVNLTDNWGLFVSYNMMWIGGLTTPSNNVVYNLSSTPVVNGVANPAGIKLGDFGLNPRYTDSLIHGLTVGTEYKW